MKSEKVDVGAELIDGMRNAIAHARRSATTVVQVYTDDSLVHEYAVASPLKGREHAAAIIATGYRHSEGNDLCWYPPHRIVKVKVTGGAASSLYQDKSRAT